MVDLIIALSFNIMILMGGAENEGVASYYHDSLHGNLTANGEIYKKNEISVAHKELEFGTIVLIVNPKNNKSVIAVVNDRGPFIEGRDFDLSRKAAEEIDMIYEGVVKVNYIILGVDEKRKHYSLDRR